MSWRHTAALLVSLLVASSLGCSTILTGGGKETVSVTSDPSGASVKVLPTGETGTTPVEFTLPKKNSYVLRIQKECHQEQRPEILNPIHPLFWGNVILGGFIGLIVDVSTGGGFNLEPDEIHAILPPLPECVPANADTTAEPLAPAPDGSQGAPDAH